MKPHLAVNLFGFLLVGIIFMLNSCSFYMSIDGKKKDCILVEEKKEEIKVKPKTRYETLKDEHNKEWLNLPRYDIPDTFFQAK